MKKLIAMMLVISLIFTASFGYADTLKLPKTLQIIDAESFYGTSSVDEVIVPYGATEIRSKAFAGSSIQSIYIPDTVEFMAEDAFEGAEDIIIYAPANSYAQEYAEGHDYLWKNAGNQYQIDQFKAAQELYENLEQGEEGALELEGQLNLEPMDTKGITNEEVLSLIEEYNTMQEKTAVLVDEYTQSLEEMMNIFGEMETAIENFPIEYTDSGVTYTGSDFSYFISGEGAENLSTDFEIISSTPSEDGGKIILEVLSGGEILTIEGSTEGITFGGQKQSYQITSRGVTLVSYNMKAASTEQAQGSHLTKILDETGVLENLYNLSKEKVGSLLKKQLDILVEKEKQSAILSNKLKDPNLSYEEYTALLLEKAEVDVDCSKAARYATTLKGIFTTMEAINPLATCYSIYEDYQRWNELGKIYEHGHPLPSELADPEKDATVQEMLNYCKMARAAYFVDAMNNFLTLANDISTIIMLCSVPFGVTVGAGVAQKAAIAGVTQVTKLFLTTLITGFIAGTTASYSYEMTIKIDQTLHGGVTGIVTNALTGERVVRAAITCAGMTSVTNSMGFYQMKIPDGTHTLTVKKQGYAERDDIEVTVENTQQLVEQDIALKPEITLSGVIRDAETGQALSGVSVSSGDQQTMSDSTGAYSITDFVYNSQKFTFSKQGYQRHPCVLTPEMVTDGKAVYDVSLVPGEDTPEPPDTPTVSYTSQDDFAWNTGWVGSTRIAAPCGYNGSDSVISIPPVYYRYIINEYTGEVTDVYEYTVTRIDSIHSSSVTSVIIPDTVTEIGISAFSDCTSLTSVTIPSSVTSIGYSAFYGCTSLTSITIPDSVTSISTNSLFAGCSSLTSVTLPDCTTEIGDTAFRDCSSLTSIEIPDGATRIGIAAFSGCSSLISITIPNSVTEIGWNAFINCSSLTSVEIPNGVTSIDTQVFRGCSGLTSVTIPNGVTEIGDTAFYGCSSLPSIELPGSITSIGRSAFSYCSSLTSFEIPSGITEIGAGTFESCSSLKSIKIPESVTSIGESAFINCSSLTDITIPDEETVIRNRVFRGCSSLTNVIIPDGVTMIETEAFSDCSSLTSIVIPEGVTSIGDRAFNFCTSLGSVTLPESLTSIGSIAFQMCRLSSITIPKGVTSIDSSAFNGSSLMTAYVSTQYAADYFAQYYPSVVVNWKE